MSFELYHGDGSNSDGASKPIHFFKIILSNTLLNEKLRIPEKFVSKYGESLSNTIFLKLPHGAEWKVNLEKHDGGVWFQHGWKEFVEYHSLAHGHLLVFIYEGTSHFHVLIFDMSATEIDYPINKVNGKRVNDGKELQPSKTMRTNGNDKDERNHSNLQAIAFHGTVRDCKGKLKNPCEEKRMIEIHTERSSFRNYGVYEASGNTSFSVIIKSCHLKRWCLWLPKGFLKDNIKPGGQNVTLLVGERSWRVSLIHYQQYPMSCLSAGWATFARENNLKEGNYCLFELLNSSDDMVMKVSISMQSSVKPYSGH